MSREDVDLKSQDMCTWVSRVGGRSKGVAGFGREGGLGPKALKNFADPVQFLQFLDPHENYILDESA